MTLKRIYEETSVPPCEHEKLVTECDDCWERALSALRAEDRARQDARIDGARNMREAVVWSKTFNRQGCPLCGGIP